MALRREAVWSNTGNPWLVFQHLRNRLEIAIQSTFLPGLRFEMIGIAGDMTQVEIDTSIGSKRTVGLAIT
jgi:hypothetical protein